MVYIWITRLDLTWVSRVYSKNFFFASNKLYIFTYFVRTNSRFLVQSDDLYAKHVQILSLVQPDEYTLFYVYFPLFSTT